jgi:hypothetical protein
MTRDRLLVISSVLSILLLTVHLTSDVVRARFGNLEQGGSTMVVVPLLALLLYATLAHSESRYGRIMMLITALIAILMPVAHVMGPTGLFTGHLARGEPGDFIFVWTLHLLGVIGLFSLMLAIKVLVRKSNS